jgi:hypothetical protein
MGIREIFSAGASTVIAFSRNRRCCAEKDFTARYQRAFRMNDCRERVPIHNSVLAFQISLVSTPSCDC